MTDQQEKDLLLAQLYRFKDFKQIEAEANEDARSILRTPLERASRPDGTAAQQRREA